jgi:RNA polymerase sigma-70 factor, ECF subfamily
MLWGVPAPAPVTLSEDDADLLARLRGRDEAAFVTLIEQYQAPLVRFLRGYLPTVDLAEDVAQETWLQFLQGIDRFQGRSALKTWIFRIGANRALTRMRKEKRNVSFSDLTARAMEDDEGDIERLLPAAFSPDSGMWTSAPARWEDDPEQKLLSDETIALARETIEQLPAMQAAVITLRDIENWTSAEVREALELSEANQRVLLHRARTKVRKALEGHLEAGEGGRS